MHIERNGKSAADEKIALILQEEKATTQAEKDIIHLKKMILDMAPYSRYWRWGYVGSLRRAIKALGRAIALQKAQEPRVMTYDEMMKAEICFLEVKGIEKIDPFIRFEVNNKSYWSSPYTNNEDDPFELLAEKEEYLINARCWTSRPTDEQREATPWN